LVAVGRLDRVGADRVAAQRIGDGELAPGDDRARCGKGEDARFIEPIEKRAKGQDSGGGEDGIAGATDGATWLRRVGVECQVRILCVQLDDDALLFSARGERDVDRDGDRGERRHGNRAPRHHAAGGRADRVGKGRDRRDGLVGDEQFVRRNAPPLIEGDGFEVACNASRRERQ
jgi:hypothetical protein